MTGNAASDKAIAIIGMSCRFAPDLISPEKFWDFLAAGRSTVRNMPEKRWKPYAAANPQATALMRETTLLGSFLDDIEGFDADFFGISPREADYLDPQQRFMLELAWEALANAGVAPLSLRGSDTGVFTAANSNDYGRRLLEDIPRTGAYAVNGTTYYGIANRVSYFLDLHGPSVAVDTACAGSLTALHLAAQSLRDGETSLTIVGGLNLMATPALNVALQATGALSADGRSKAFDKDADGYGRGEGAGVMVLKRLADARRDGDPILAVILGSGVFQDGRSDGMMAPNADAQEHMLREIYARLGISPASVDYVEAHGTGTPTGDGKEIEALAKVFGAGRAPADPCLIGSVKPNIGHVEGGSGIAGVIKTVLAMQHEQLPPSLHNEPTPDVDWANSGLRLVGETTPWRAGGRTRRAGVSSYGVGGTIAHLVLEESPVAPEVPATETADRKPVVYPISAMSEAGLRAMATTVADWLVDNPDAPLSAVGHTLARRRSHLSQRAAVVAKSAEQLTSRLRTLADGAVVPGTAWSRTAPGQQSGVVWVFSGHGAQWSGMGRQLLAENAVFAATIDQLADVFRAELGWTPREAIDAGGPWTSAHVQALTFAVQVGLAEVWRSHGLRPSAVIGHSVGEIAAAVTAGSLGLQEAARFACRRAAALQRLEGLGRMAMAALSFEEAKQRLAGRTDVEAAISASPHSTVISGDKEAVDAIVAQWRQDGVQMREVDSEIAFHSKHVDVVISEVEAAARKLSPRLPMVTLYSTALAQPRSTEARDSRYWAANLRQPVLFAEAIEAALEDGHRLFLEVSSHPVVSHSISEAVHNLDIEDAAVVGTLARNADEVETLLANLGKLHCNGAEIDWSYDHPGGALAALPSCAWQHRPYWIFPDNTEDAGLGGGHDPASHSLLGGKMTVSGAPSRQVWQTYLDVASRPYPLHHGLVGVEVTPAASILNTFAAAAADGNSPSLTDIVLRTPLAVEPPRVVQIVREGRSISLATRVAGESSSDDDEWLTHTTATIDSGSQPPSGRIDADALRARLAEGSPAKVGEMFERMGVGGYAFPWEMTELRQDSEEQLAVLDIVPPPATLATSWAHVIDGALTISAVVVAPGDATTLWMSKSIERVAFRGEPPAQVIVHSKRSPRSPLDTVDVWVSGLDGEIVCVCTGLRFAAVEHLGSAVVPRELVHEIAWRPVAAEETDRSAELQHVVFVGDPAATAVLARRVEAAGLPCIQVDSEPDTQDAVVDLLPEYFSRPGAIVVVPSLARPGEALEKSAERSAWTLVRTVQRLVEINAEADGGQGDDADGDSDGKLAPQRIWALTRGVRDARDERSVAHGPLWGASRIIAGEHPELWGGAVDVDAVDAETGAQLLTVLRGAPGREDVISLTPEGAQVARLTQIERSADGTPLQCSPAGTVLITGGLGALGLEVARWLVDQGARRILLAGRRGLPPRADWDSVSSPAVRRQIEGVLGLEALGVTVGVVALDITDAEQVAKALAPGALGLPPIRGIVHAAGVVNDAMVDNVDLAGLQDVLAPKANGAMVLHRLFPPGELEFFVLFSSCGQFARLSGQTSYAAANSFLDALAAHRNSGGHTETRSIGWTAWQGVGLSSDIATTMLEANSRGLESVSVSEAFRAWSFGDRFRADYQAVLRVLPTPPNVTRLPMFRELTATDEAGLEGAGAGFSIDFSALTDEEAHQRVIADVREQVAAELNLDPADVELKRPLVELGVDSVMTVALRVRLQRRYGLDLPPTILWAKPTVAALSEHIIDSLRP
jgi:acyl transferase domain-containing protein/acyl carrier protein